MTIFQRIDDFRKKALKIDSLEMTLRRRSAEHPILFSGYGEIVQTADDEINFKMYAELFLAGLRPETVLGGHGAVPRPLCLEAGGA